MEAARTNGARTVIRKLEEIGPDPRAWTADQSQTQSKLAVRMSSDAPNMVYDRMLPALMYDPTLTMQAIRKIDEGMRVRPRRPRCPPTRRRRRSPRTRKPCVRLQQSCDVVRGQDAEKRWSRVLVRGEEVRVALKQTVRPNSPGLGYRCSYTAWTSRSTEGSRDIRPSLQYSRQARSVVRPSPGNASAPSMRMVGIGDGAGRAELPARATLKPRQERQHHDTQRSDHDARHTVLDMDHPGKRKEQRHGHVGGQGRTRMPRPAGLPSRTVPDLSARNATRLPPP
jgi:hypothetical protein